MCVGIGVDSSLSGVHLKVFRYIILGWFLTQVSTETHLGLI